MPELMTTAPTSHAERGSIGGRTAAQRMTPEARQERGRRAYLAGAAKTVAARADELSPQTREEIRAALDAADSL